MQRLGQSHEKPAAVGRVSESVTRRFGYQAAMRRVATRPTVVCAVLLAAASGWAVSAPRIDIHTLRPYGYTVGDTLRHSITVEPEPGYRLDEASLPRPGPVNRWLELRQVSLTSGPGIQRRLVLEYQTFYAPLSVKTLTIPGFSLRFTGATSRVTADIPAWPFSMSPIHGLAVLAEGGLEPLRPDALPEAPATRATQLRFSGFALSGLIALLYMGHLRGLWGFGRRGRYFHEAERTLRRLGREGEEVTRVRAGFAAVHRAFDRTLDEPLFAERLPEFFADHADYAALREDIEAFFQASYALFFGNGAIQDYGVEQLAALCRACVRIERGRPR